MLAYGSLKGIPGSKLYEYIGSRKPVLLFPNDHDVIEKMLLHTGQGIICENAIDLKNALFEKIDDFILKKQKKQTLNTDAINSYSRLNQCKKLVSIIEN
jgi:hypothetical protein